MKGNLPAEVFLDTSIFLARMKGEDLKNKADRVLRRYRWKGTGSYVKLEYGNVVLSACVYLLDTLKREGTLEKLRYFINNQLPSSYHSNYKLWFFNLLSKHFSEPEATERAERLLRSMLRVGTGFMEHFCDEVQDSLHCVWADQRGSFRWKKPKDCGRTTVKCGIAEFFSENRPIFIRIRDAIRSLSAGELTDGDELSTFAEIIDKADPNPEILREDKNCRALADAIIAVQSRTYKSFFTQNPKESSVLCRVLGQLLLCLRQDLADPVACMDYRTAGGHQGNDSQ